LKNDCLNRNSKLGARELGARELETRELEAGN
jgi:hypothetical protein